MKTNQERRRIVNAAALMLLLPTLARAQDSAGWPARPIRIVVPFPPGGTTDFVSRLISTELSKTLAQKVYVENKPGAGTVIGVDTVAKSAGDGSNFVTVTGSFTVNSTLVRKLPYDTLKDLRPVAMMGMSEHVLATYPASGLKNLDDLRELAKRKPESLSYASFGAGTSAHLAGELLNQQLGIDLVHVPYKGQSPALVDLLGGQVTVMFGNWPELRGHVSSGKLVALGMATAKRSTHAPDIPTLTEQGAAIVSSSWNGLLAPSATPDDIVARMNAAVNDALASPAIAEAFAKGGIDVQPGTPAQFGAFIEDEIAKYAEVIRKADIKLD